MYNKKESKTFKVIYWIESNLKNLKIKPYYLSFILDCLSTVTTASVMFHFFQIQG